jgi:chemotaxis signal transduction protein
VCAFGEDHARDGQAGKSASKSLAGEASTQPADYLHADDRRKKGDVQQLVSFQVGREEFAFLMGHVREILRVQTPKEVPGAPAHLLGVLTVRGKILPIVDLRRLLRQNSFAGDQVTACTLASAGYRAWLAHTDVAANGHSLAEMTAATELFRQWLTVFNSSSRTLTETLAKMRTLNEHISKQVISIVANSTVGHELLHRDILQSAQGLLGLIQTFEAQVEGNIREDQRIIVVDSNGFQLGLVVDHVNEVLHVPDDAIELPPSIADQDGIGLSGIAKLEDGNRLILLLATADLLDRKKIEELAAHSSSVGDPLPEAGSAETVDSAESALPASNEEGKAADGADLQLVTFLLGKEEYGIPIAKIQEIDRLSNITQTPKAPKFVEGVTNLRGEVIPVLSTRTLFALEPKASDDRTRVIIVDLAGAKTGLIVDSVREVLSISSSNIAPPPASISTG